MAVIRRASTGGNRRRAQLSLATCLLKLAVLFSSSSSLLLLSSAQTRAGARFVTFTDDGQQQPQPQLRRDYGERTQTGASMAANVPTMPARSSTSGSRQRPPSGLLFPSPSIQLIADLKKKDTCGMMLTSVKHGYHVEEYKVTTEDKYELTLHRIVHPARLDHRQQEGSTTRKRKPYLLLHGLVGSSASFVRSVDPRAKAPKSWYNLESEISELLAHKVNAGQYERTWQSTADRLRATYAGDTSCSYDRTGLANKLLNHWPKRQFAQLDEIDYDGDPIRFGREFKQAYRKFELPALATASFPGPAEPAGSGYTSSSLAYTLANFGYDVWLVNLRGNQYSRRYNGPLNAERDLEYWDFDIDTIVQEDLPAAIQFVRRHTGWPREQPLGLVSYSYSSLHVLALLTRFPVYQQTVQPIVMVAPAALTLHEGRHVFKHLMQILRSLMVAKNGPFPSFGRGGSGSGGGGGGGGGDTESSRLERLVCRLPVAARLCRLLETILHGRANSVGQALFSAGGFQSSLLRADTDCGQTSTAVLKQVIANLAQENLHPKYQPWVKQQSQQQKQNYHQRTQSPPAAAAAALRRSVMLVHSQSDPISTPGEVRKIRDSGLKTMALLDYTIKEPNFGHTDFLFSQRNQFLVNAEIVRMVGLFDVLIQRPSVNEPMDTTRGY